MPIQPEPDAASGGGPFALLALSDRFSDRTRKVLSAYLIGRQAYLIGKGLWGRAKAQRRYTVAVLGEDAIYPDLHRWLLDGLPRERQRAVIAQTSRDRGSSYIDSSPSGTPTPPAELHLFFDGTRQQTVDIGGHKVVVTLERPEWTGRGSSEERLWALRLERVLFTADSLAGREAVYAFLTDIAQSQKKRLPRLYSIDRWSDGWRRVAELPIRPLETVVLRDGQQERLIADLAKFLTEEQDYARLGLPYHRGYLFHGPPGTGKTSMAKALAGHFGLDVYYIALTALKDDAVLNALFSQVDPRSALVLEDVDIVHAAREGDQGGPGVTLQGLLNTLDGFATPHGLITFMTTNDLAVLDERLVRAGRVDMTEEIGLLDHCQLRRLIKVFLGEDWPQAPRCDVSPAAVVDVLKRHLGDPEAALSELAERYG